MRANYLTAVISLTGLIVCLTFSALSFTTSQVFAGGNASGEWFTQWGKGAPAATGDYVSDNKGLDTYYSYFIEVFPGLSQLDVDIFDADVGAGGVSSETANNLDGAFPPNFNTVCVYTLIDPSGTTVATMTGDSSGPVGSHNAWLNLYSTISPAAGHWELRVDTSSAVTNGNDMNAYGIRAHDGDSGPGGTELNIYTSSFVPVGTNDTDSNPNSGDSRVYNLYPFVTSGADNDVNDFDFDNTDTGATYDNSIALVSRTGAFSNTIQETSLSGNNAWANNVISGWTTDTTATDYGIWSCTATIYELTNDDGNYGVLYFGNSNAAIPPPTTQPETNTFRTYLPTDAGAAPVKPFLDQSLSYISGPNPPTVGSTTRVQITITFFNPTDYDIVFTPASELIGARIPAASEVVYANNAVVSQGSIRTEPAVGGSGETIWDPGTVSAGTTASWFYQVDITPSSAGQRIEATETDLGQSVKGIVAIYTDETGNATYEYGALANPAVTEGGGAIPTLVVLSGFRAYEDRGQVVVQWETASEIGTLGFHLLRLDEAKRKFTRVNDKLLPGLLHSLPGGTYRLVDPEARASETYTYKLVEIETGGGRRTYGPFTVTVAGQDINIPKGAAAALTSGPLRSTYSRKKHNLSAARSDLLSASRALRKAGRRERRQRVGSKVKITVTENGLYYLDAADIAAVLGLPCRHVTRMIKGNLLHLSSQGQAVAYRPASRNTGIYFYGQGANSIFTDENVYWLSEGQGLKMQLIEGTAPAPAGSDCTFAETLHIEEDRYPAMSLFTNPKADYWFWDYIVSGDPSLGSRSFDLRVDGAAAGGTATLTVNLHGTTATEASPDYYAVVSLNGVPIGEAQWEGIGPHKLVLTFNQSLLIDGDNVVEVKGVLGTGVPFSIFYVDSFELNYQRRYEAADNALLVRGDENPVVTISGFADSAISVYEVTEPGQPKLVTATTVDKADGGYRVSFAPSSPNAVYLTLTPQALRTPASVVADVPSSLKHKSNRCDYLVITPAELKEAAQALARYRHGKGLETKVVELEDIYDEFNHGIASPEAIREFLRCACHDWEKAPRYVMLAGNGTFDYKDNLARGDNLVPPLMVATPQGLFASDNRLVDTAGNDGVPEMAVGRLPVLTNEELHALIDKMVAYESTSGGAWEKQVLMLADNPDGAGDFPGDSDDIASLLPPDYTTYNVHLSDHSISEARELLLEKINDGVVLLNYIGHAGVDRLAHEGLLLRRDVESLSNGTRLPIVTAVTCFVGQFAIPGYDSLGEALVLKSNGGAVAFWGASGLSFNAEAKLLGKGFYQAAFELREQSGKTTLGEVVLKAMQDYAARGNMPYMLDTYNLLGDPALEIRLEGEATCGAISYRRPAFQLRDGPRTGCGLTEERPAGSAPGSVAFFLLLIGLLLVVRRYRCH